MAGVVHLSPELLASLEPVDDGTDDGHVEPRGVRGGGAAPAPAIRRQGDLGKRNATGHRLGAWHQRASADDATVRKARALRVNGKTYDEIGQSLNVPWLTVRDWCTYRTRADA